MHNCLNMVSEEMRKRIGYFICNVDTEKELIDFTYSERKFAFLVANDAKDFPLILTVDNNEVMPHILEKEYDLDGKKYRFLCLLRSEDYIATHIEFSDKVNLVLDQFEKLLNMSPRQRMLEMQKEFLYYWDCSSNNKSAYKLYVPFKPNVYELDIIYVRDDKNSKKSVEVIVKEREKKINDNYLKKGANSKALFIPITNSKDVLPPHRGSHWTANDVLNILRNPIADKISETNCRYFKKYKHKGQMLHIVFSMKIPSGFTIMFVIKIEFDSSKKELLLNKISSGNCKVSHIYSQRFDKEYMMSRIGLDIKNTNLNLLIAGVGSLGSYIVRELPKIGINKITMFDSDEYKTGNVLRHILPVYTNGLNKAYSTKIVLERQYPELEITAFNRKFGAKFIEDYGVEDYDVILIAIGNTDAQLEINKILSNTNYQGLVIYTWLEPEGVGAHVLSINYRNKGCYQCLFHDEEGNVINNSASLIEFDDSFITENGCGGSFTSYGNLVLLEATSQIIEVLIKYQNGDNTIENQLATRILENGKSNFNFTDRYEKRKSNKIVSSNIYSKGCELCANKEK